MMLDVQLNYTLIYMFLQLKRQNDHVFGNKSQNKLVKRVPLFGNCYFQKDSLIFSYYIRTTSYSIEKIYFCTISLTLIDTNSVRISQNNFFGFSSPSVKYKSHTLYLYYITLLFRHHSLIVLTIRGQL